MGTRKGAALGGPEEAGSALTGVAAPSSPGATATAVTMGSWTPSSFIRTQCGLRACPPTPPAHRTAPPRLWGSPHRPGDLGREFCPR